MLIDTHAHLNFNAFKSDFDEVIKRSLAEDIWMINVGSNYETSKKAVEIAEKYNGVFAAIGLHPIHAKDEEFDIEKYKKLVLSRGEGSDKVVAIGEIGLDYFKDYAVFKDKQKKVFFEQLELTKELNLPVIFHCRKAHDDLIEILENHQVQGVIHCFSGRWSQAKQYLDMGFYLGINGIMYKFDLKDVIEKTPLEKILIETDCPYLLPSEALAKEGLRVTRNEPVFIKYIVQDIAKIKGIDFQKVAETTFQNAKNLFRI
ncbi:TatD family hydrolase [Patescibacteria group bacterium]|nr:TatD family hydrolase [Patescibacteria group bacterium]